MRVTIRDHGDLKAVNRLLREQADGRQLRKDLGREIRGVLRPLVPQVRAAYLAMPSQVRKTRSRAEVGDLRTLVSKSVRVEVKTAGRSAGARIRADGRRMPNRMKALPAYLEGEKPRFRHPLFGNRSRWIAQQTRPVFYRTLEPHAEKAGQAIQRLLEAIRHKLEAR